VLNGKTVYCDKEKPVSRRMQAWKQLILPLFPCKPPDITLTRVTHFTNRPEGLLLRRFFLFTGSAAIFPGSVDLYPLCPANP
jgi:hypothetical protein